MQQAQDTLYNQPIVIDNGSGTIRAGFAGDETPKINYSNVVGKPKYQRIMSSSINQNDKFIGSKAQSLRGLLKLQYPISHGVVTNWNNMETVWAQVFGGSSSQPTTTTTTTTTTTGAKEQKSDSAQPTEEQQQNQPQSSLSVFGGGLSIKPEQHPLLITEQPLNPRSNRTKLAETLFETFGFPALHISIPAVLSLYSSGRTTGMIVDSGDGVTTSVPVFDGFSIPGSIKRLDLGGRDITELLKLELMKCGYSFCSSSEFEIVRSMKERLGFVELDCGVFGNKNGGVGSSGYGGSGGLGGGYGDAERDFVLPDGKTIGVSDRSLSWSCELLFSPETFGYEMSSVDQLVYNSLLKTDIDLRGQLASNIILAGGSTMFRNFGSRLLDGIQSYDDELKLKIYASPDRKVSCFVGGSILASLSTFKNIWISKEAYRENPDSIHAYVL
ncbi:unnamed protein product [Ambrosiozyma monospora]|uniref:Unnamed protein product n=1 Tax=Ambrosiozyma monospora TaxID=43982 RepID=A0ACB5T6A8_AMBMO|nr:unnamed protein product [Ambrosiozyma monospora]